jgi:NDP-sugar pyrophosphorylase family protein
MQAVIMAGGKGTRLHPYSAVFPKPLMPLGDMPILELLLRRLKKAGVTEALLAVNHLSSLIEAFFGAGEKIGLKISYNLEDMPLGTAGALGLMLDRLEDTFLLTNGDLLTTLKIEKMVQAHRTWRAGATIGAFEREVKIDFGLLEINDQDQLIAYKEKPTSKYPVSIGLYVLDREAVRPHVRPNEYLDMPNLLVQMKNAGTDVRCFRDPCIWLDIGRPDDFAEAQTMFEQRRAEFLGE